MCRSLSVPCRFYLACILPILLCSHGLVVGVVWGQEASAESGKGTPPKQSQKDSGTAFREAKEIFDYHQIRGRKSLQSETGILEGELDFALQGSSRIQGMSSFGPQWSGNAHLLWDGSVGDSMESSFEVD